jgi:hypothetical protein
MPIKGNTTIDTNWDPENQSPAPFTRSTISNENVGTAPATDQFHLRELYLEALGDLGDTYYSLLNKVNALAKEVDSLDHNAKKYVDENKSVAPYWMVKSHATKTLTNPTQFNSGTILAEFKEFSYGSIQHEGHVTGGYEAKSRLYNMTVKSASSNTVNMRLFSVDDSLYTYVNGSLITADTQYLNNTGKTISLNLSAGTNVIQFVYNDSGEGLQFLYILGDIVNDINEFIESS